MHAPAPDPTPPAAAARLQGLAPVAAAHTVLLVLGSFPGAASLAAGQYYAHPRNQFWPILQAIWPDPQHRLDLACYQKRIDWLLAHRLGLWDVYASCERQGSLDTAIRAAELNDFAALKARCPALRAVAHNGRESHRHARRVAEVLGLPTHRLPSTSPAHASWGFERKLAAWRELFQHYGVA